uniref:DUF2637 domain-containing protein n=1 Tax=Trebonia sp. TaxID=2767075 RepID=UPI002637568D
VDVVTVHGEPGAVGHWYPVLIDGLIVAASMVLLDAARHRESAPGLAWGLLSAGIGATLAVNVLAGVPSGWLGAIIAAWPALAFVGSYELLMMIVRAAARRAPAEAGSVAPRDAFSPVPSDAETAAAASLRATIAAGNPLSLNQVSSRFGLTRQAATKVRDLVLAEANGRHPEDHHDGTGP